MTQEELDALMAGDLDEMDEPQENPDASTQNDLEEFAFDEKFAFDEEPEEHIQQAPEQSHSYPPPSPTDDNKMVYQLDDVTKDSELKAGQVFDKLEAISAFMAEIQENTSAILQGVDANISLFETLCSKFPNVPQFATSLEENKTIKAQIEAIVDNAQMAEDEIMMTMDIMQYQDIHRQKIERVINVMRALSKYMSHLFEGKVADETRVSSAVHIDGDTNTSEVMSNDDIEALIESLGNK